MIGIDSEPSGSRMQVRFVLMDRTGPIADFETWEDAFQYMAANPRHGGNLVRSEEPMGKRPSPIDCSNDDRDLEVRDAASARGRTGRLALCYSAGLGALLPKPGQSATKSTKN